MTLSHRAQRLEPSATLAAAAKAKKLKTEGFDILNLTLGEPDYMTPETIRKAAIKSIESGEASFYTPAAGIIELRQAVIERIRLDYGLSYDITEVAVTDGAKFALYALFQAIINAGDEVIIPTPYWVSYGEQVKLAEGKPVFVTATHEAKFKVTVDQLEKARTAQTKALILTSPSNPTGAIYSPDELEKIGNWAVSHNILIIADDIYGKLVYNGHTFTPMATISEAIRKQTVIINGVSKSYAMTGWRIGYVLGDEAIIQAIIKIASQSTSNCSAVSQYAALEALRGDQSCVEEMRQAFEQRLNVIYPKVSALPGVVLDKPEGAFYLFPNVAETMRLCGYTAIDQFVDDLLTEAQVAVVSGAGFGAPEHIRLSYASDLETLQQAIARLEEFIAIKQGSV
ncbi:pyridoxal phosphate-dependent aminotransferase [Vagococcus intermedius]|uniref:Aminotransferase n=1 Tax=Vagococcus intermedius TaxID=2991418 RepID=A0AAF0CTU3_9ENTE|nr:pyridoxal phosphate-dependent aminotransferase [Vagococcus intermedius]WEG72607.1 pyridoxal phosphate-dependent aminotransferase [Vagococcus intermedius]WEG74692.1 pyridoxal phosphate-dependent aminotransferase [Vagococcus intermedius]